MKVYLQYPWKFPDSPYYKYLVRSPPIGIEYQNVEKNTQIITNKTKFWFLTRLKVNLRKWTNILGLPIANSWKTSNTKKYNLIHCAHCLSKNNFPWVADMESPWSMWVSGMNTKLGRKNVEKLLLNTNCKKIMPWTNYTKEKILKMFPNIANKLEVVYPAVPLKKKSKKNFSKNFTVTFVGRDFRLKGGKIALEIMRKLKLKYPSSKMIFISSLPIDLSEKYSDIEKHNLLPSNKIGEILSRTDLFLYPSLMDTFGFSILEAMSFGVPVVALETDLTPSIREIIKDGTNGKVIKTECTIDDQTEDKVEITSNRVLKEIEKIILDKEKLKKISKANIEEIKKGKFSILERNKKLKKIYEEALK